MYSCTIKITLIKTHNTKVFVLIYTFTCERSQEPLCFSLPGYVYLIFTGLIHLICTV